VHKGYTTPEHSAALTEHGPCVEHRFSYVNVRTAGSQVRQTGPMQEPVQVAS
jgi:ribonuclease HII